MLHLILDVYDIIEITQSKIGRKYYHLFTFCLRSYSMYRSHLRVGFYGLRRRLRYRWDNHKVRSLCLAVTKYTVTLNSNRSDGLGHVFAMIGRDWTHIGVAKLYTDITRNGYKIMYLTSRAIGQADATRDYLKGIKQNDYQLPEGPVIMSPDRLMASLHR